MNIFFHLKVILCLLPQSCLLLNKIFRVRLPWDYLTPENKRKIDRWLFSCTFHAPIAFQRRKYNEILVVEEEMTCNQFTFNDSSTERIQEHTVDKKMKNGVLNQKKRWTIFTNQWLLGKRILLRLLQLKIGKLLR